jgi:hypothetical protein
MTLLDILEHKFATTSSPDHQVTETPPALYEGSKDHVRIDSIIGADPVGVPAESKPITLQLWYDILEAATDASKIALVAENLLVYAWPEKNATETIKTVGNPQERFRDDDELRLRLRDLLFPNYNTLTSFSQT